jgi:hypothetical protein
MVTPRTPEERIALGKNRPAPTADASHRLRLGTLEALGEDGIAEKGNSVAERGVRDGHIGSRASGVWRCCLVSRLTRVLVTRMREEPTQGP